MRVVMLSGATFDVPISPEDMWVVYSLVRNGNLEAVVVNGQPIGNVRKIDPERTFGDLIARSVEDTAPTSEEVPVVPQQRTAIGR